MNDKKKAFLILGTAVAFLVVMTVLVMLVLKFQLFNVENPQQPSEPASQGVVPDDSDDVQNDNEQQNGNGEENTQNPEGGKDEGGFKVTVDEEDEDDLQPGGGNTISFDDLLNAAQKNEG